jgi:hypothetical protein
MLVSIVISVYNSHEAVRRQAMWFARMGLPDDVEFILVDDGSIPPLDPGELRLHNLRVLPTGSTLAWTQGLGRNLGAEAACGEMLLMTDIDHILSREAIEAARRYHGPKMIFRRKIGVLDERGYLRYDRETLREWGFVWANLDASVHGNTWAMPRAEFRRLGGYDPATCTRGYHPISKHGDDCYFNQKWNRAHRGVVPDVGPDIYMFPVGRFNIHGDLNPFGLFHDLHQREVQAWKGDELRPGAFPVSSLSTEAAHE